MLSILIPIYNQPCLKLVRDLAGQAQNVGVCYEIICMDDCSTVTFEENKNIPEISGCRYIGLKKNIGRSKIRNSLAKEAKYDYLLFLDCDSKILRPDYIKIYMEYISQNIPVISGGRVYEKNPPKNIAYYFHWKYGTQREPKPEDGQGQVFMSNNFVIKKKILEKIPFNKNITRYGHEDSLFQMELHENGYDILFIDNPIVHIGLDESIDFLRKTRSGVFNLLELYKSGILNETNVSRIKLLKTYIDLKKYKLRKLISLNYILFHKQFEKNLLGKEPDLFILDIYKLCYLAYLDK